MKEEDDEPNYSEMMDDENIIPSLRDTEYLQHGPLWGHQFMTGMNFVIVFSFFQ